MLRYLLLSVALLLTVNCAKNDKQNKSASTPPDEAKILTTTKWCRAEVTPGNYNLITQYDFAAGDSKLTENRILQNANGEKNVQLYKGENLVPWKLNKENKSVPGGYVVEIVKNEASGITRVNLHTDYFRDDKSSIQITSLVPCSSLVNIENVEPKSISEFQIFLGRLSYRVDYSNTYMAAFLRKMDLVPPIKEIKAKKSSDISLHTWCAWDATTYDREEQMNGRLDVTVLTLWNKNGVALKQTYRDMTVIKAKQSIADRSSGNAIQFSSWQIDERTSRLSMLTNNMPDHYKLVQDAQGTKALFAVANFNSDFPPRVSPESIYYDCNDPRPLMMLYPKSHALLQEIVDAQSQIIKY